MRDLEGSGVAAPQAGERRWIVAAGLGAQLSERRQTRGDDECGTAEKIATVDRIGHEFPDWCAACIVSCRCDAMAPVMLFGMKV
jgi:hypothetical protein